jgi:hypothetical protein
MFYTNQSSDGHFNQYYFGVDIFVPAGGISKLHKILEFSVRSTSYVKGKKETPYTTKACIF